MYIDIELLKIIKYELATSKKRLSERAIEVKECLELLISLDFNKDQVKKRKKEYFDLMALGLREEAKQVLKCIVAFEKSIRDMEYQIDDRIYRIYEMDY